MASRFRRQEVVDVLRGAFDIETILQALDIETVGYTGAGRIKAFCPLHPRRENKPQHWTMDPETGQHHCFSCGAGGSLVSLVCDLTDMDIWEAIGWLRSEGLQQIVFERPRIEDEADREEARQIAVATTEEQWSLFNDPPVEELAARRITLESSQKFDVRWSPPGEKENELLLRNEAWAFPLLQWDAKFLGYQLKSKRYVKNVPVGVQKDQTFFGIAQFPVGEEAIVVESPLDAVMLSELGYFPLAIMGSFLSNAQAELLLASTNRVVVALDYDAAGKAEARRLLTVLQGGMRLRYFEYRVAPRRESTGRRPKDPGEMTDGEIVAAMRDAKLPHECGRLLGPKPEPKQRRHSTRSRRRRRVR